jgi:hypothetical protein
MNKPSKSLTCSFLGILLFISYPLNAAPFFQDDFESGNLLKKNSSGAHWTDSTYTGVTATDPQFLSQTTGTHALLFKYPATPNGWSEERFTLGVPVKEIWISFWLHIPKNFKYTNAIGNSKLAALWMDDYSAKGKGPTVVWEFWSDSHNGTLSTVHYSSGNYTITGSHLGWAPFIKYPDDQNQWFHMIFHVKAATSAGSNDGLIETFMRRKHDPKMTLLYVIDKVDIAPPAGGPNGWLNGYFMGWSNPGYAEATEFLLDNVEFSTEPPYPLPPNTVGSPPKSPTANP